MQKVLKVINKKQVSFSLLFSSYVVPFILSAVFYNPTETLYTVF